ncbi:MAG: flagellar hook-basal body complex protein [Verrucomicrobiota bacterium]|jgi:flagellar hook protein FlgE
MLTSLSTAVTGLNSFQQDMDVIGNNIANINTDGFKAGIVNLADNFSDTLQSATGPIQVGTGVYNQAITSNWTQGAVNATGINTDLAISGNGFFVVQDPVSGSQYVTQDGSFSVNAGGFLVTAGGQQVQGYNTAAGGAIGPIKIDATGAPATAAPGATVASFAINSQGQINVTLSDGTTFTRGQVLLQNFQDPQALISQSGNLYSNMANAGPITATPAVPGTNGLGQIQSGYLEISNVDLSTEMANLITAQRGFEANSKIVTTSDELLQTLVNMKH